MSSLKTLAQKAKNRLKAISNDGNTCEEASKPKTYSEACLSARLQYAIISSQKRVQDDPLYNKVKRMLTKNIDVTNPLAQIIEHEIYDSLSDSQKERYMFKLSKRYIDIKKQVIKDLKEENII